MSTYDWTTFQRRIPVHATVESLYTAWTTADGLESWFLKKSLFSIPSGQLRLPKDTVQKNDAYEWYWFGYPDTSVEKGAVLEANGYDSFHFTFATSCIVKVSIYTENNESICQILQTQIPEDEKSKEMYHVGCSTGWTFYLANLKSILEGGLDLRNKNEHFKDVINS